MCEDEVENDRKWLTPKQHTDDKTIKTTVKEETHTRKTAMKMCSDNKTMSI